MFRTIEIEGEPCTVWAVCPCERGTTIRVSAYHPLRDVEDCLLEDVPAGSVAATAIVSGCWLGEAGGLAHLANTAPEGPRAYLEAMAGVLVHHSDRRAFNLTQEARRLWSLITGLHWLERPRASLPNDPTEPPF